MNEPDKPLDPEVQAILDKVSQEMAANLKGYIGQPVNADMREHLKQALVGVLGAGEKIDRLDYAVMSEDKDRVTMKPNNFISALAIVCPQLDVPIPWDLPESATQYECPAGTFHWAAGELLFIANQPVQSIKVEFTVNRDGAIVRPKPPLRVVRMNKGNVPYTGVVLGEDLSNESVPLWRVVCYGYGLSSEYWRKSDCVEMQPVPEDWLFSLKEWYRLAISRPHAAECGNLNEQDLDLLAHYFKDEHENN